MRKTTRIVAAAFGVIGGGAGLGHGIAEFLQGNTRPASLVFASMGPPCAPERAWHACEPAMSIIPNLLITGLLACLLSLLVVAWSAGCVQRKAGGAVLILLSAALLLFGGRFFPPLISLAGAAAGTQINRPLPSKRAGGWLRLVSRVWPWPLTIFVVWVLGQYAVGYFFNDFLKSIIGLGLLLIVAALPASIYTAYACDHVNG